jgi:hypothetical protein
MGRALGDVIVLNRHSGRRVAQAELAPRARSLRYVDAVRGIVHAKDFEEFGGQGLRRALHLLDPDRLETELPVGSSWDRKAFDAAVEADVADWLETERASRRWQLPGSAEQVGDQLREMGFGHLAA